MPRLSAALIVKDEAAHLPACLAALRDLADEICVVDTGSTDGTRAIARDAGCRVAQAAWTGDFSVARNRSLDLCTGDWVIVIDADERIAAADAATIRAHLDDRHVCYRMTTRTYTNETQLSEFTPCTPGDPHAGGFAGWTPSTKVRLFPNGADARFAGAVHELVNASLETAGIAIRNSPVPIHHYPFTRSAARLAAKRALYLELGRAKAAAAPDDPKPHAELGNQYLEAGDAAAAISAYREAIRLAPGHAPYLKDLGGALAMAQQPAAAERAFALAVELDPGLAEAWRNLGVVRAQPGNWAGALPCFTRATELAPEHGEGWRYRALALEQTGDLAQAAEAAARALANNPASTEAAGLYASQMERLGRKHDAAAFLERLRAAHGDTTALRGARAWLESN